MITTVASEASLLRFLEQKSLSWSSVPYRPQLNDLPSQPVNPRQGGSLGILETTYLSQIGCIFKRLSLTLIVWLFSLQKKKKSLIPVVWFVMYVGNIRFPSFPSSVSWVSTTEERGMASWNLFGIDYLTVEMVCRFIQSGHSCVQWVCIFNSSAMRTGTCNIP